jgi:hypothetical protein
VSEEIKFQELEKRVTHAEDLAKRSFKMIMIGGIVYLLTISIFGWMYVNSIVATSEISKSDKNQKQMLEYIEKRVTALEKGGS